MRSGKKLMFSVYYMKESWKRTERNLSVDSGTILRVYEKLLLATNTIILGLPLLTKISNFLVRLHGKGQKVYVSCTFCFLIEVHLGISWPRDTKFIGNIIIYAWYRYIVNFQIHLLCVGKQYLRLNIPCLCGMCHAQMKLFFLSYITIPQNKGKWNLNQRQKWTTTL